MNKTDCYKWFVGGLIQQLAPIRILEIGMGNDLNCSALYFLDIIMKHGLNCSITFIEKYRQELVLEKMQEFPPQIWNVIEGEAKAELFPQIIKGFHGYDMVLVDGDHSAAGVFNDLQAICLGNALLQNGLFVFHDIRLSSVRFALKQACIDFGIETFCIPQMNLGLGKFIIK